MSLCLKPFFSARIPPEIIRDYESAKEALENIINDGECGESTLAQVPLLLAGLTSSISLSVPEKVRLAETISRLSANQLGQLSAIFIAEICGWGTIEPHHHPQLRTMWVYFLSDILLRDEDTLYQSGDKDFGLRYLGAWDRLGCKMPLVQRLAGLSDDLSIDTVQSMLARLGTLDAPPYPIRCAWDIDSTEARHLGSIKAITPDVAKVVGELRGASDNPFLVAWLYDLTGDTVPAGRKQELEPAACEAGVNGYFLIRSRSYWKIPDAFSRYAEEAAGVPATEIINQLLNGDDMEFLQAISASGLTKYAISIYLDATAGDIDQLTAIAKNIWAWDRALGMKAMAMAVVRACEKNPAALVDSMIHDLDTTPVAILNNLTHGSFGDTTITYLASRIVITREHNPLIYLRSLELSDEPSKAFDAALGLLEYQGDSFEKNEIIQLSARVARKLKVDDGFNPFLDRLITASVLPIRKGLLTNWFASFARSCVKNRELSAAAVSSAILSILKDAPLSLRRQEQRALISLLGDIDAPNFVSCINVYLDLCPVGGDSAASHLGNGAWKCYLGGDYEKFLDSTERALVFSPEADWLLCNRAFALYLLIRPQQEVMAAYRQAVAVTLAQDRWQQCAIDDLEQHATRRPGAGEIPLVSIAEIAALGASLPATVEAKTTAPESQQDGGAIGAKLVE